MSYGRLGYEAYAASTGGRTYDGRDMPTWDQVCERTPHVAQAWEAAGAAIGKQYVAGDGMDFGSALAALKAGKRVARAGWNGKGMWIALTPGSVVPLVNARAGAAQHVREQKKAAGLLGDFTVCPHIDMKAADGSLVIGWLASQTDMLANDWAVVVD